GGFVGAAVPDRAAADTASILRCGAEVMTPVLVPHNTRRMRQLPPVRRSESAAAPVDEGASIVEMLQRLSVSQWVVLLYPMFLFAIHRKREEGDVAVVDVSAMIQIGLTCTCAIWMLNR